MRACRRLLLLAPFFAAALLAERAVADPSPPPGWEAPPPLAAPGARKRGMPAGCAADKLCSVRQIGNDVAHPDRVERVVDVRFADLPELVVREAPAGGPSVMGAPGLTISGAIPAPSSYSPEASVRAAPVGAFGAITWEEASPERALEWLQLRRPFHRDRGTGPDFGAVHKIPRSATDLRSLLAGHVDYTTIDEGPGGTIAVDYVRGELAGTAEPVVSRWGHADAATVVGRYLHAFRAPGEEGGAVTVTFVMPSVFVDFEAKDVKHAGGFVPIGHTIAGSAFTSFTLPAGPGGSGIATFHLRASEIAEWFPQPGGAEKPAAVMRIALSSSRTSAEGSARVRVMFFARDALVPDGIE